MKKFSILLFGALALGFTACDESPVEPPVQTNVQPPMYEASDVTASVDGALASTAVIKLADYEASALGVPVVKFTPNDEFPADGTFSATLELSKESNFGASKSLDVTVTDGIGYVDTYQWNDAQVALFGKSLVERHVYWRVDGFVHVEGGTYHLGAPDHYVASGEATVLGIDLGLNVSEAYYFVSDATSWQLNADALAPYKMYHSVAEAVDDPIFTYIIYSPNGNCYWKIAPQEALADENWEVVLGPQTDGDTSFNSLVVENGKAGRIEAPGLYKIEFDAVGLTYTITKYDSMESPYLFTPGDGNSWSLYASQWLTYDSGKDAYLGVVNAGGTFKIVQMLHGATWDGNLNWGGADEMLVENGGNINANGFYWMTASPSIGTYELLPIDKVSLIGGGDWSTDRYLTPNDDKTIWTAELDIEGEWKLRFNDSWDYNYGAPLSAPQPNGGNFNTEKGHYLLTVDFRGNLPYITVDPR